jgi:peptidyl-prolyl cis-trans isomerase B (cyclophilin B)
VGVKVSSKKVIATTTVACFILAVSAVALSAPGYASDLKSSHPTTSPKATSGKKSMAPLNSSALSSSGCEKTTSHAHYAPKVGTPDTKVPQVDHTFTLTTNCGDIVFTAFGKKAPVTVIAMSYLAKSGFFDHSLCHRLSTSGLFALQCGDPTASGSGGPMWSYNDENLPVNGPNNYPAGTIATYNSGVDSNGRGTNGSQFLIFYKDTTYSPSYTVWGQVTSGLDIVKRVAAAGVVGGGTDGKPKQTLAIESVSVK